MTSVREFKVRLCLNLQKASNGEEYSNHISRQAGCAIAGVALAAEFSGYAQRERGRLRVDRLRAPDERNTVTGLGA